MTVEPEPIPDELVDQAMARFENLDPAEYDRYRKTLAEIAKMQGADKFSLLQGLRAPRNTREKNLLAFYTFQGSEDDRKEIIRRYAERPVDHEMLDEFHAYVERDLQSMSDFLGAIVLAANECEQFHDPRAGRKHERAAQNAYERLCDKSEMYSTELIACSEFLADLNCKQSRGVVEIGAMAANSYHELVSRITSYVRENWKSCCRIARDSQNGSRYSHPASASSLFKQSSFESVPQPQRLYAHMEDEYRRAKIELGDDADLQPWRVPDAMNAIEIVETVDSGLYGKVYKGVQSPLNRSVAVKIIKDCGARTADVIAHARLLTRVQHPAIVTVFSVQKVYIPEFNTALPSIVMEWLEGATFGRRLADARFTADEAILLCRDVVDGIAELHRSGLCHGDLHFGNVIVLSNGHAKIIDIDANKEASLARMSLHSRDGAMSADVDYCRGIMFKTLQHSNVSLSKLSEIEIRLQAADSLKDLQGCIETIDIENCSS